MKRRTYPRAALSALLLSLFAAVAMLVSPAASGQGGRRVVEDLGRALESFDRLRLDPSELLKSAREGGRVTLRTSRGTFELEVEPFDIRAENYRAVAAGERGRMTELPRTPSRAWRGTVRGAADTHVRLVLDERKFEAIVVTPDETYYVEPTRDLSASAGPQEFVFYAGSDVKPQEGAECGTTLAETVNAESGRAGKDASSASPFKPSMLSASSGVTPEAAFSPKPEAKIATEADFEYFQANGSNATATNQDILDIFTQVDAIYDQQLGIRIRVVFQRVWTANNDPYTLTAAGTALEEFRTSYDASFAPGAAPARNLTHMFTGKDLDGSIIGIAYLSSVCDRPDLSYGISQSKFSSTGALRVGVTAHELGHNFGASHPNQESSLPPSSCDGANIMNSSIQSTDQFCRFSLDQITNHVAGNGGSCLIRLVQPGCVYTLTVSPTQFFAASGGQGRLGIVTSQDDCQWSVSTGAEWIAANMTAVGGGGGDFRVEPNTSTGPREATLDVAGQKLTVRQAASPTCVGSQIAPGQTVGGTLAPTDCRSGQPDRANASLDLYTFTGRAGQHIKIEMLAAVRSSDTPQSGTVPPEALDTFLYLFGPDGSVVDSNDDLGNSPHNSDSLLPHPGSATGFLTLPATGVYTIAATSFSNGDDGDYTLKLSDNSSLNGVSLSSSAFSVDEGTGAGGLGRDGLGFRNITVSRTGSDVSGTATVDYATFDASAGRQQDYTQAVGTLVFGPGETSKFFTVFVSDDAFQEGPESLVIELSNPVGAKLGPFASAMLTINSANDASSGPSPVRAESFNSAFFVRQQYLDFLHREPDTSGVPFWQNDINQCGANAACAEAHRINTSAAFFLSIEFQETGYLAYRMYSSAYGDATSPNVAGTVPVIRLNEFLSDTQRIGQGVVVGVGNWQQQLEANKNAFALEFVLRQRFINAYPLSLTPEQFVDQLNRSAGLVLTPSERDQYVAELTSSPDVAAARASVLRRVAENATVRQRELNRAFVLMQYYGYLRRNPDDIPEADFRGWKFWLDKLNQFNGNFVQAEMVKAFLSSTEYINRFGNSQ
ncbi:MAG: hypothetical protein QOJ76_2548 [Acidobacteriota bacterium]|nr:hypothetical protein [Acidobacteriota bacterium]